MELDRVHFRASNIDDWARLPEIYAFSPFLVQSWWVYTDSQPVGETFQGITNAEVRLAGDIGPYGYVGLFCNTPGGVVTLYELNGSGVSQDPYDSGVVSLPADATSFFGGATHDGAGNTFFQLHFRARP